MRNEHKMSGQSESVKPLLMPIVLLILSFMACSPSFASSGRALTSSQTGYTTGNIGVTLVGSLGFAGYDDLANVTDWDLIENLPLHDGVWYHVGHGVGCYFDGIQVTKEEGGGPMTFTPDMVPPGLDYDLVFLNSCSSGVDPGASMFYGATAAEAYLGWNNEMVLVDIMAWAEYFFEGLNLKNESEEPNSVSQAAQYADNELYDEYEDDDDPETEWSKWQWVILGDEDLTIDRTP
jgi:hypothetical protein